ncbi:MAG: hypothetical protein HC851_06365 [Acaryochloris sp. RU_4_1]|nr:hypothetical protein [Acaryochloris sp. SU_5_25]NJM65310.1 hypothetical protein [Acaryochloris sp. RU_4_1]NJR55183.1 hypothetical protein [Acaryochloris sp. CRU_2_0]
MIDRSPSPSTPCEIVCLEHQGNYLYAEVIQIVADRQRSWVRPLFLQLTTQSSGEQTEMTQGLFAYHLHNCSDLVWPSQFFRPALDEEVLPLLMQMQLNKQQQEDPVVVSERDRKAHQALRQLTQHIWQTFPDAFSN